MFIGIGGIIGSGKSSLTKTLSEILHFEPVFEPVGTNIYLEDFYKYMGNTNKYKEFMAYLDSSGLASKFDIDLNFLSCSIPAMMQIHLLSKRYILHQRCLFNNSVADRTIYEDTIFAKMLHESKLITDKDFETYQELFQAMKHSLMYPQVIIYLNVSLETAMQRIKKRSRSCETSISWDYLASLKEHYTKFIKEIETYVPVINLDWNEDLVPDSEKYYSVVNDIKTNIMKISSSDYFRTMLKI